eukprot:6483875-Amphidinium_carterae.1
MSIVPIDVWRPNKLLRRKHAVSLFFEEASGSSGHVGTGFLASQLLTKDDLETVKRWTLESGVVYSFASYHIPDADEEAAQVLLAMILGAARVPHGK